MSLAIASLLIIPQELTRGLGIYWILGLTSIGLVTGPANVTTGTERIDGYRMALRERGMRDRSL